jgi:hypothetical protein
MVQQRNTIASKLAFSARLTSLNIQLLGPSAMELASFDRRLKHIRSPYWAKSYPLLLHPPIETWRINIKRLSQQCGIYVGPTESFGACRIRCGIDFCINVLKLSLQGTRGRERWAWELSAFWLKWWYNVNSMAMLRYIQLFIRKSLSTYRHRLA